jgi:hypothetical protein
MPIKTIKGVIAAAGLATATATAALALTACSAAATSAGSRPAAKPVLMTDCNGLRHTKPGIVNVVCESDAITARSLHWSGWGRSFATASGTAVVDLCAFTDCHTGSYNAYPIVLIASKPVTCPKATGTGNGNGNGKQVYSRLQYVFVGHDPFATLPVKALAIRNSLFGSHRPGPPHNHTVTLPC